jgi:hypothetical protein
MPRTWRHIAQLTAICLVVAGLVQVPQLVYPRLARLELSNRAKASVAPPAAKPPADRPVGRPRPVNA